MLLSTGIIPCIAEHRFVVFLPFSTILRMVQVHPRLKDSRSKSIFSEKISSTGSDHQNGHEVGHSSTVKWMYVLFLAIVTKLDVL